MTLILAFVQDQRTLTLAALILADVVFGIAAALRTRTFDARQVGNFYRTNVVPFILGYLLIYTISLWGIGTLLGPLWGEIVAYGGAGPAVVNLGMSIARNLAQLRPQVQP